MILSAGPSFSLGLFAFMFIRPGTLDGRLRVRGGCLLGVHCVVSAGTVYTGERDPKMKMGS